MKIMNPVSELSPKLLQKPLTKLTIQDAVTIFNHSLKEDAGLTMAYVKSGLTGEVKAKTLRAIDPESDIAFNKSGQLKKTALNDIQNELAESGIKLDVTVGEIMSHGERAKVESIYGYQNLRDFYAEPAPKSLDKKEADALNINV